MKDSLSLPSTDSQNLLGIIFSTSLPSCRPQADCPADAMLTTVTAACQSNDVIKLSRRRCGNYSGRLRVHDERLLFKCFWRTSPTVVIGFCRRRIVVIMEGAYIRSLFPGTATFSDRQQGRPNSEARAKTTRTNQ